METNYKKATGNSVVNFNYIKDTNKYMAWKLSTENIFTNEIILKTFDKMDDDGSIVYQIPLYRHHFEKRIWRNTDMMTLKWKLNKIINSLDKKALGPWYYHTNVMNPTKFLINLLRLEYKIELCSKGWCKIVECMSTNSVIPESLLTAHKKNKNVIFKSVHLCEAPGNFIAGLNHYLKTTHKDLKWEWIATSLNPYHENNGGFMMSQRQSHDDKLIRSNYKNWNFLKDSTGNIMNRENIKGFIINIKQHFGSVQFVTGNGNINFQNVQQQQQQQQQNYIIQLQYSEIIAALSILEIGGSFFLRIFTFYESPTMCHLYLLCCTFEKVKLIKPSVSKVGNSELYVLCTGYLGKPIYLKEMIYYVGSIPPICQGEILALYPLYTIPQGFIQNLVDAATLFTNIQVSSILRNIESFQNNHWLYNRIKYDQMNISKVWMSRCNIKSMDSKYSLFPQHSNYQESIVQFEHKYFIGQDEYTPLTLKNTQEIMIQKLNIFNDFEMKSESLSLIIKEFHLIDNAKLGKPYINILFSGFCDSRLLAWRSQLRELLIDNKEFLCKIGIGGINSRTKHCETIEQKEKLQSLITQLQGNKPWILKCLCYNETIEDLGFETDAEATYHGLTVLVNTVKKVHKGHSLFLCEFPLLTRLHIGFIFAISSRFDKTIICIQNKNNIQGILLHGYKRYSYPQNCTLFKNLTAMLDSLQDMIFNGNGMGLECNPIYHLINNNYMDQLNLYNFTNVYRSIKMNADCIAQLYKRKQQMKI